MAEHPFETLLILSKASSDATNDFLKSPSHERLDKLLATSSAVIEHCERKLKEHQKNELKSRD